MARKLTQRQVDKAANRAKAIKVKQEIEKLKQQERTQMDPAKRAEVHAKRIGKEYEYQQLVKRK